MATIPRLEPNVQVSAGPGFTPADTSSQLANANATNNAGAQLQNLGLTLSQAAINMQTKMNTIAVNKAQAQLTEGLLSNQQAQLAKKGEQALYQEATKDKPAQMSALGAFNDLAASQFKDISDSLQNNTQRQELATWYGKVVPDIQNKVAVHQQQQLDATVIGSGQAFINKSADAFSGFAQSGSFPAAGAAMRSMIQKAQEIGQYQGLTQEQIDQNINSVNYKAMTDAATQMIKDGKSQEAYEMVNWFAPHLTEAQRNSLKSLTNAALTSDKATVSVQNLFNDPANRNADGSPNITLIRSKIDQLAVKTNTITTGLNISDPRIARIYSAAAMVAQQLNVPVSVIMAQWGFESSGFDSQLAKENNNLSGLTQTEPNGEENKQPDGQNYYKTYNSIEDFANDYVNFIKNGYGSAVGQQDISGYVSALKNGGYFTADLNAYINGVNSVSQQQSSWGTPTTQTVSETDQVYQKAMYAEADRLNNDWKINHQQRLTDAQNEIATWSTNNPNATLSEQQAEAAQIGQTYGLTSSETSNLVGSAIQISNRQEAADAKSQKQNFEAALQGLYNGSISSMEQVDATYGNGVSIEDKFRLKTMFAGKYKWANQENMLAIDGVVKANRLGDIEKGAIIDRVNQAQKENIDNGGGGLSFNQIVQIANDLSVKTAVTKTGFLGTNANVPAVDIPQGGTINPDKTLNYQGATWKWDTSRSQWVRQ